MVLIFLFFICRKHCETALSPVRLVQDWTYWSPMESCQVCPASLRRSGEIKEIPSMMIGPRQAAERRDIEVRHLQAGHIAKRARHIDQLRFVLMLVPFDSELLELVILFLIIC